MIEVRVLRLAAGGDGVGKLDDGRTVFIPRTAPGDLVALGRTRLHRRFARARLSRLVEAAPGRVEPPCPHYVADDCGGCQLQHLDAPTQRDARRTFVGDALRRLGRLDVADPPLVPAPDDWAYRTKLTLHPSPDRKRIGLHPIDRPDDVFDLRRCLITRPELTELWTAVSRNRRFLPGELHRLVLRLDRTGGRHLLARVHGAGQWTDAKQMAAALAAAGVPAVLWWQPEGGAARAVAGSGEAFPATVFEQVHPSMGDRARAAALAAAGDVRGRRVWDLYAGIGETTTALLEAGALVESVESDGLAVEHAERHGTRDRSRVVRHTGLAEELMPELADPEIAIVNPPRTGLDGRVAVALAGRVAARIVYLSCDPATLARDVARMSPAFRLETIEAFDLFPQTAHVETVAVLVRV